jgi:hypothetical protein
MAVMMMPMIVMAMVTMPSARQCQWNRSEQHKCHAHQSHFSHLRLHTQVLLVFNEGTVSFIAIPAGYKPAVREER